MFEYSVARISGSTKLSLSCHCESLRGFQPGDLRSSPIASQQRCGRCAQHPATSTARDASYLLVGLRVRPVGTCNQAQSCALRSAPGLVPRCHLNVTLVECKRDELPHQTISELTIEMSTDFRIYWAAQAIFEKQMARALPLPVQKVSKLRHSCAR